MYTNIIYYEKVPRFKPNGIVTAFHVRCGTRDIYTRPKLCEKISL
jgi:hypothetical protein